MIPEEDDQSVSAMTTLMGSEKRKQTLSNITHNQATARLQSGSKRYSEPIVGGAVGYQNPWDESKRASVVDANGRKRSNLPGSLKELGRGLNRKLMYFMLLEVPVTQHVTDLCKHVNCY